MFCALVNIKLFFYQCYAINLSMIPPPVPCHRKSHRPCQRLCPWVGVSENLKVYGHVNKVSLPIPSVSSQSIIIWYYRVHGKLLLLFLIKQQIIKLKTTNKDRPWGYYQEVWQIDWAHRTQRELTHGPLFNYMGVLAVWCNIWYTSIKTEQDVQDLQKPRPPAAAATNNLIFVYGNNSKSPPLDLSWYKLTRSFYYI